MSRLKRSKKARSADFFRLDRKLFLVIMLDVVFYLTILSGAYLFNLALLNNLGSLESIYPTLEKLGSIYDGSVPSQALMAEAEAAKDVLKSVMINSIIIIIGFMKSPVIFLESKGCCSIQAS